MGKKVIYKEYNDDGEIIKIQCRTCHQLKDVNCFARTWRSWESAYNTQCKDCVNKYCHSYRRREWKKEHYAELSKAYRETHYDELIEKQKQYYKDNKDKIIAHNSEYRRKRVQENWFARERFHEKARKYVKKIWISFTKCYRCGDEASVELHHPSYECKEMRSIVVPLCRTCHRYIEWHPDECPHPIDLLLLENER